MAFTIALAGKGGTGKTTVAGMLIKYLVSKGKAPVLAAGRDPHDLNCYDSRCRAICTTGRMLCRGRSCARP